MVYTFYLKLEYGKHDCVDNFYICLIFVSLLVLAAKTVIDKFPELTILTSEIHPVAPNHFGQKYFGTT